MQGPHKNQSNQCRTEPVRIEKLDSNGSGFGRLSSGKVVFVPGVLPDELVRVRFNESDGKYLHGNAIEIIEPAPQRIAPPCPYFSECAGCIFQILSYPDQLDAKRSILVDQLSRIGKLTSAEAVVLPFIGSPKEYEYRSSMKFRIHPDGTIALPGKKRQAVPIAKCMICRQEINDLLGMISFEEESGLQGLEIRTGWDGGIQMVLSGTTERPELELETDLPVSIVYSGPGGSAVLAGDSSMMQQIEEIELVAADDSPFFPNPLAIALAAEALKGQLSPLQENSVVVVPAGTGFWTKWLSSFSKEVVVLDREDAYLDDFLLNLDEAESVSLILGEFSESILALGRPHKLVLYDSAITPIRKGVLQTLCTAHPEILVGIYRDTALFARDCLLLQQEGFDLKSCLPVDEMPQTAQFLMIGIFSEKIT